MFLLEKASKILEFDCAFLFQRVSQSPFKLYSIFQVCFQSVNNLDHYNLKAVFLKKILFSGHQERKERSTQGVKRETMNF